MLLVCLESSCCKLTMNLLDRGIDWSNIIYPKFKLLDDRIRSFSENYWLSFINLNANVLAKAGFSILDMVILLFVHIADLIFIRGIQKI